MALNGVWYTVGASPHPHDRCLTAGGVPILQVRKLRPLGFAQPEYIWQVVAPAGNKVPPVPSTYQLAPEGGGLTSQASVSFPLT